MRFCMELKDFIRTTLDDITSAMKDSQADFYPKEIPVRFELDVSSQADKLDVVHGGAVGIAGVIKFERKVDDGTQETSAVTHRLVCEMTLVPPKKSDPFKGGSITMKPARFR